MPIEFNPVLNTETGYPFMFSGELKEYDILKNAAYTLEYQNDCVVSYMSVNDPPYEELAFRGVNTADKMTYTRLTGNPALGQSKNLFTILVGEDSAGTKVKLIGTVTCSAMSVSSLTWTLGVDIVVSAPNQASIVSPIFSNDYTLPLLYQPAAAGDLLCSQYRFGLGLLKLPLRPDNYAERCLVFFHGGINSGDPIDAVSLSHYTTAQDGTRQYDVRPNVNKITNPLLGVSEMSLGFMIDLKKLAEVYAVEPTIDVFSPEAGEPSGEGGMDAGSFDNSSDTIAVPTAPTTELVDLGFYHVYKTSSGGLNNLGKYVFGEDPDGSILSELVAIGQNMFRARLVDYIVSCHTIPVDPTVAGTLSMVRLGGQSLEDVLMTPVTTDYVDFDCGTISLDEYYSSFADFLDNCKLFLPFIGFVPARPEWFKRTSLNVTYRFNVIDGSCVAFVSSTGRYVNGGNVGSTVVGQYSGTASIRYPVTGLSYAGMATGVIGAVGGMAAAAGAGSLLGVAGSAVNMSQARPDVAQSNGYNACSAMMGVRRPYLYIERPVSSYAQNYQHELGIPSNVFGKLGSVSGFVKMENVHLEGIDLTESEKEELRGLLAAGVIN